MNVTEFRLDRETSVYTIWPPGTFQRRQGVVCGRDTFLRLIVPGYSKPVLPLQKMEERRPAERKFNLLHNFDEFADEPDYGVA